MNLIITEISATKDLKCTKMVIHVIFPIYLMCSYLKKKSVMIEIGYIYVSTLLDMVPKHVVRDSACFCEGVLIGPTFKSMDVE